MMYVDNIREIERKMFSKKMGLAGTADVIADWDGKLSVIDFKTTKRAKREEWIEGYFLQSTAYALMYEENTGTPINQIVIVFTGEDGTQDTYVKDKAQYVDRLYEVIGQYLANLK
jgi:genome maintenance exonuclease 1